MVKKKGGLISSALYFISGIVTGVTIIFIPHAKTQFRLSLFCLNPFGKEMIESEDSIDPLTFFFLPFSCVLALNHLIHALICSVSIVGAVFAEEHFKLAFITFAPESKLIIPAPAPFGKQ